MEAEMVRIMMDVVIVVVIVMVVVVPRIVRPGSRAGIPSHPGTYFIPFAIPLIPIVLNDSTPKLDQRVPFQI